MATQSSEFGIAPVPEKGQLVVVRQRTYTVKVLSSSCHPQSESDGSDRIPI